MIQCEETAGQEVEQVISLDQSRIEGSPQVFVSLGDQQENPSGSGIVAVSMEDLLNGTVTLICEEGQWSTWVYDHVYTGLHRGLKALALMWIFCAILNVILWITWYVFLSWKRLRVHKHSKSMLKIAQDDICLQYSLNLFWLQCIMNYIAFGVFIYLFDRVLASTNVF